MGFAVYDFRNPEHVRNLLVTPEIRARILRMEPGQGFNTRHSHDLGHEIFLILQGRAEFEIDGHSEIVEPGQLCFALRDEAHAVRVIGDEPVIMYLSVTPHILPTHTGRTESDDRKPASYAQPSAYDLVPDETRTRADRIASHRAALDAFKIAADALVAAQKKALDELAEIDDTNSAIEQRDRLSRTIYEIHRSLSTLSDSWNEMAPTL